MPPFEQFFAGDFQRAVARVQGEPGLFSNGSRLQDASWDRKAAYLLWKQGVPPPPPADDDDDFLGPAPITQDDTDFLG